VDYWPCSGFATEKISGYIEALRFSYHLALYLMTLSKSDYIASRGKAVMNIKLKIYGRMFWFDNSC
jgi:hypothetical protein